MSILVLSQGWLKPEGGVVLGLGNDEHMFGNLYVFYGLWELCLFTFIIIIILYII